MSETSESESEYDGTVLEAAQAARRAAQAAMNVANLALLRDPSKAERFYFKALGHLPGSAEISRLLLDVQKGNHPMIGCLVIEGFEVQWSAAGVWVNHPKGFNVARLNRIAREVHRDAVNTCAACCFRKQEPADWPLFVADVWRVWNVAIPERARPPYLKELQDG